MNVHQPNPQNHGHGHKMDAIYRKQVAIYDITRKYYLLGRDRLISDLAASAEARVMEVACGTGRNLIRIVDHYPEAEFYGMDISSEMLAQAQKSMDRTGLSDHIHLAQGDACTFDPVAMFGQATYDRLVFSYCISMIPDWQGALRHAAPMIAPGGSLHIVDFGTMSRLPGWFRAGMLAWLNKFHVTPRDELQGFLSELATEHGLEPRFTSLHRDYASLATLHRPA